MKNDWRFVCLFGAGWFATAGLPATAQIALSSGGFSNNFDSLGISSGGWINNTTLPGWYASKGNGDATNYLAGGGTSATGGIYSFGVNGTHAPSDRALGSLAGSSIAYAFGVRLTNDLALPVSNLTVSCVGEQWRSGGTAAPQILAFSWQVADGPLTNSFSAGAWSVFPALNFIAPDNTGSGALDGNAPANRQVFSSVVLAGVVVDPGQELFLRWLDVDDSGSDHALAMDDFSLSFNPVPAVAPFIVAPPQSQVVTQGGHVTFTVEAGGTKPLSYQWRFFSTNLAGATASALTLSNVTTAHQGGYEVVVTNQAGVTNSATAVLTVELPPPPVAGFSLVTYNVGGSGAADWSTNAAQVRSIANMLCYLNPDIVTFNEIPHAHTNQMPNWLTAFFPGYQLVVSPGSDNFNHSAVLSRFPVVRSQHWLDGAQLEPWGYTNSNFTRDLFEVELAPPGFPRPLHVFAVHLKSSDPDYNDGAAKRAAEAAAITNWFATNFFVRCPYNPYTLSGDVNEANTNTLAIQRLLNPAMDLYLTNPTNPITGRINTFSTATANPGSRIDYIFPCGLLYSNIVGGQVFRSMVLTNPPPPLPLVTNDEKIASDHLPVMLVFENPYTKPFRVTAITRSNPNVTLEWESVFGQPYRVDVSSNHTVWGVLASNLTALSNRFTFTTNLPGEPRFFRVYRVP